MSYSLRRQPTAAHYEAALVAAGSELSAEDIGLLRAQAADGAGWTAADIGAHYGSDSYRTGNLRYGRLGRILEKHLGGDVAPVSETKGRSHFWAVLATGQTNVDGLWEWTMRDELRSAVKRLFIPPEALLID